MTVAELIEILEEYPADAEVHMAFQPSWPLDYTIGEVVRLGDSEDGPGAVYLAEGQQIGYLPGEASAELGWR